MTWPQVKQALEEIKVAIIPVGSTEQHGPHGRFQMDTSCAREFAKKLGERLYPEALVVPAVPIGVSEHHIRFPGTLSLRPSTLIHVLMDIAISLYKHGIRRFFFVNAHGGNRPALSIVANRIKHELGGEAAWATLPYDLTRDLAAEFVKSPVSGHSCENEISILLYLWPDAVDENALSKGQVRKQALESTARRLGIQDAHFFDEVTENGALGDATKASVEFGKRAVEVALERIVPFMREFMARAI